MNVFNSNYCFGYREPIITPVNKIFQNLYKYKNLLSLTINIIYTKQSGKLLSEYFVLCICVSHIGQFAPYIHIQTHTYIFFVLYFIINNLTSGKITFPRSTILYNSTRALCTHNYSTNILIQQSLFITSFTFCGFSYLWSTAV